MTLYQKPPYLEILSIPVERITQFQRFAGSKRIEE